MLKRWLGASLLLTVTVGSLFAPVPASAAGETFSWRDSTTIIMRGGITPNPVLLRRSGANFTGAVNVNRQCTVNVTISRISATNAEGDLRGTADSRPIRDEFGSSHGGCPGNLLNGFNRRVNLGNPIAARDTATPEDQATPGSGPGTTATTDEAPTDLECDAGAFSWAVCPLITNTIEAINFLKDKLITPFLEVEPLTLTDKQDPIYVAWDNIKNISLGFLVIVFLYMIYTTTTSIGPDNYTVKKVLPRLVVAVILMHFSFMISALMIDFGNVLGEGVNEIVPQPPNAIDFRSAPALLGLGAGAAGAVGIAIVASAPAVAGLGLMTVITAFLAILGVAFTLLFRQALIVILVIFSPLAFLAWTLPNTEKYFDRWRTTLMTLILMYPIIEVLFISGTILSWGIAQGSNGVLEDSVAGVLQLIALVIPLFMIPATFKMAGGLMGRLAGAATMMTKGSSNKLKNSQWAKDREESRRINNARRLEANRNAPGKLGAAKRSLARVRSGAGGWLPAGTVATPLRSKLGKTGDSLGTQRAKAREAQKLDESLKAGADYQERANLYDNDGILSAEDRANQARRKLKKERADDRASADAAADPRQPTLAQLTALASKQEDEKLANEIGKIRDLETNGRLDVAQMSDAVYEGARKASAEEQGQANERARTPEVAFDKMVGMAEQAHREKMRGEIGTADAFTEAQATGNLATAANLEAAAYNKGLHSYTETAGAARAIAKTRTPSADLLANAAFEKTKEAQSEEHAAVIERAATPSASFTDMVDQARYSEREKLQGKVASTAAFRAAEAAGELATTSQQHAAAFNKGLRSYSETTGAARVAEQFGSLPAGDLAAASFDKARQAHINEESAAGALRTVGATTDAALRAASLDKETRSRIDANEAAEAALAIGTPNEADLRRASFEKARETRISEQGTLRAMNAVPVRGASQIEAAAFDKEHQNRNAQLGADKALQEVGSMAAAQLQEASYDKERRTRLQAQGAANALSEITTAAGGQPPDKDDLINAARDSGIRARAQEVAAHKARRDFTAPQIADIQSAEYDSLLDKRVKEVSLKPLQMNDADGNPIEGSLATIEATRPQRDALMKELETRQDLDSGTRIAMLQAIGRSAGGRQMLSQKRDAILNPPAGSGRTAADGRTEWSKVMAGVKVEAAPDLVKGNAAFEGVSASDFAKFDHNTKKRYLEYVQSSNKPELVAEAQRAINDTFATPALRNSLSNEDIKNMAAVVVPQAGNAGLFDQAPGNMSVTTQMVQTAQASGARAAFDIHQEALKGTSAPGGGGGGGTNPSTGGGGSNPNPNPNPGGNGGGTPPPPPPSNPTPPAPAPAQAQEPLDYYQQQAQQRQGSTQPAPQPAQQPLDYYQQQAQQRQSTTQQSPQPTTQSEPAQTPPPATQPAQQQAQPAAQPTPSPADVARYYQQMRAQQQQQNAAQPAPQPVPGTIFEPDVDDDIPGTAQPVVIVPPSQSAPAAPPSNPSGPGTGPIGQPANFSQGNLPQEFGGRSTPYVSPRLKISTEEGRDDVRSIN